MRLTLISFLCATVLTAAEPSGFKIWAASDLKTKQSKLAASLGGKPFDAESLGTFGNQSAMLAHRESNGQAEQHETVADLFVVVSGTATLVIGGEIPNAQTTGKGELRGTTIEGGDRHTISAGDIVHIPARTPHQLLVPHEFTYFVLKVSGQ